MSQRNQHTENRLKEKLQQHEFDFAPEAWDAMDALLDQTDPPESGPQSDNNHRKGGWIWWRLSGLLLLIGLIALSTWLGYRKLYNTAPMDIGATTENTTTIPERPRKGALATDAEEETEKDDSRINQSSLGYSANKQPAPSAPTEQPETFKPTEKASDNKDQSNYFATSDKLANKTSDTTSKDGRSNSVTTSKDAPDASEKSWTSQNENLLSSAQSSTNVLEEKSEGPLNQELLQGSIGLDNNRSFQRFGDALGLIDLKLDSLSGGPLDDTEVLAEMLEKQFQEAAKAAAPPKKSRWEWGLFAGLSIPIYSGAFTAPGVRSYNVNILRGLTYGTSIRYRLNKAFWVEANLTMSSLTHQLKIEYDSPRDPFDELINDKRIHQLSVPLTLHLNMGNGLRLFAGGGPSLRFFQKSTEKLQLEIPAAADLYNAVVDQQKNTLGFYSAGLAYDRGPWVIEVRLLNFFGSTFRNTTEYTTLINGVAEEVTLTPRMEESQINITFGRRFGLGKKKFVEIPLY